MYRLRKRKEYLAGEKSSSLDYINTGLENKSDMQDMTAIVSDNADVVLEEDCILTRRCKPKHRRSVKKSISYMNEEEQMALAIKISERDHANHVKCTEKAENEHLRKAIEESLHHCVDPDAASQQELTVKASSSDDCIGFEENVELPLSQMSKSSSQNSSQNPVVLLKRLSQDIVESSSIILSPNCKDPVSCIESWKTPSYSPTNISDPVITSLATPVSLSPVFSLKSPCASGLLPRRWFQRNSPSVKLSDEMDKPLSLCSEILQLESTSVFPTLNQSESSEAESSSEIKGLNGSDSCNASNRSMDDRDIDSVNINGNVTCSDSEDIKHQKEGTVHYYWGVPFCPRGQDPSAYTKVILCQLEVYEKSLKQVQKQLLNKTEFGQPILLAASNSSLGKQENNQGDITEENTGKIVDDSDLHKTQSYRECAEDSDSSEGLHYLPSKKQKVFESPVHTHLDDTFLPSQHEPVASNIPVSQDDQVACNTQVVLGDVLPAEYGEAASVGLGESPSLPPAVKTDGQFIEHDEDPQEDEITICPDSQPSQSRQEHSDSTDGLDINASSSVSQPFVFCEPPDIEMAPEPVCPQDVECPICGCTFSQARIEMHAAYCDGTNSKQEMAVLRPRHKRSGSRTGSYDCIIIPDSDKCEKCFLCTSLVPLKDYQAHVDNCLQNAVQESQGNRKVLSTKKSERRDGRLLSMLEQSESSPAATNRTTPNLSYVSPPREEPSGSFSSEQQAITDSPIRSFVSISDAKDCLVDFKKQFSRQPNRREPKHRGKGKSRRM